jgi:hypothetical protein
MRKQNGIALQTILTNHSRGGKDFADDPYSACIIDYYSQSERHMTEEDDLLFISETNTVSGLSFVFEDDGDTGWLYLLEWESQMPTGDCWVYNRIPPIPVEAVSDYPNRGMAPPVAEGYAGDQAVIIDPVQDDFQWKWSADGKSIVLFRLSSPLCCIVSGNKRGYSKLLLHEGPWGNPWDQAIYDATF